MTLDRADQEDEGAEADPAVITHMVGRRPTAVARAPATTAPSGIAPKLRNWNAHHYPAEQWTRQVGLAKALLEDVPGDDARADPETARQEEPQTQPTAG